MARTLYLPQLFYHYEAEARSKQSESCESYHRIGGPESDMAPSNFSASSRLGLLGTAARKGTRKGSRYRFLLEGQSIQRYQNKWRRHRGPDSMICLFASKPTGRPTCGITDN